MSAERRELAILAYHKIGAPPPGEHPTWNYVPEQTFLAQLGVLRVSGFEVVDLESFLAGLPQPRSLPPRAALLTFDDGYRSMLTVVLPHLRRLSLPAVVFVPTRFIGDRNRFDSGIEPDEAICDWNELRELERHGVAVQSHGVSHRRFSELDASQRADELATSKAELEAGLGRSVDVIAYPYGDAGAGADALRTAGYRAACLYGGGPVALPVADPYRLTRLALGPDSDLSALLNAP